MEVVDDPDAVPEPVMDFAEVFTRHRLDDCEIGTLERTRFYERAKRAFALARTGEMRPYGNILLVKGVVNRVSRRKRDNGTAGINDDRRLRVDQRRLDRRVDAFRNPVRRSPEPRSRSCPRQGCQSGARARRAGAQVSMVVRSATTRSRKRRCRTARCRRRCR
jgi:hypothetical protein